MKLSRLVSEILNDAAFQRQPKPYKNVYFIKALNPGDGKSMFVSFRFKTSKNEVLVAHAEIDLDKPSKNVSVGVSYLWPIKRESITFFRKRQQVLHKSIPEILQQVVAPLIIATIEKVENYYVTDSSNH
ncbi:hypothetical protein OBP_045 [Pseudomonas phage OBP]|uniref:hypothetical protein n=1 Tax=Pseudomonas phage OBP TaxID=1124849 RepID=UPI000240D62A|nr:hypothetical protein OBP_045 [Pseudomonas phage OBP]AEV89482.1 hypothetical protein OBP_045 [Pseudomonas phage OBP]